ncbi:methyltransferase [Nonomuraea sp. NPDC003804]|uniref:methyltransferase n=1 Tax=Nonomuraea sp. NPDC003804 TaxID=3154547 RepID=UPI0033BF0C6E
MESANPAGADLESVMGIATGFWRARTLFSAVELRLFTLLAEGPATRAEIEGRCGLHPRSSADFLDALVALGLLVCDGESYANSPSAERYLDETKPSYVGGFLTFMGYALYPAWGRLTELLRTGELQEGFDSFGKFYQDRDRVRGFMAAMDSASAAVTAELIDCFDWSSHESFVDLGGARGNLTAHLVKAHPHLRGICLDMPPLKGLFEEHVAQFGVGDRAQFHAADFLTDPLPEADVMIFGHVLHDWDEESRAVLVKRAFEAIRPGGALLIYDELIDDDRSGPVRSLLMSLNMKLVRSGAAEYTAAECRAWLLDAGFTDITVKSLTATERLVTACKK